MKKELKKLISEQEKDKHSPTVRHQIIQPVHKPDLSKLKFREKIVWACLKTSTATKVELGKFLHRHPASIWRMYRKAQKKMEKCNRH